ncbi:hypothetical protein ACS0TY_000449 [Phlomoides rotata]
MEGEDENSVESEEDEGVHRDCFAVSLHASEFHLASVTGKLEEQSRLQENEEYNSDKHGAPIRHCCLLSRNELRRRRRKGNKSEVKKKLFLF